MPERLSDAALEARRKYQREWKRAWRKAHLDRQREYERNWRAANLDKVRETQRRFWEKKAKEAAKSAEGEVHEGNQEG